MGLLSPFFLPSRFAFHPDQEWRRLDGGGSSSWPWPRAPAPGADGRGKKQRCTAARACSALTRMARTAEDASSTGLLVPTRGTQQRHGLRRGEGRARCGCRHQATCGAVDGSLVGVLASVGLAGCCAARRGRASGALRGEARSRGRGAARQSEVRPAGALRGKARPGHARLNQWRRIRARRDGSRARGHGG